MVQIARERHFPLFICRGQMGPAHEARDDDGGDQVTAPAGEAKFDDKTKKLVWTIPTMPTSVDVLALQFPIILQSKNSTQTNLTSKVKVQATDTVTGQSIIKVGDEVLLKVKEN